MKCYKCHQLGHLRRDYLLLRSEKGKASKKDDTASMSSGEDLLVVSDGSTECDTIWRLDLACLHHYTSHREWFAIYQKFDGGSVSLRDDHPCKVAKISSIRMRMYDWIIRTLSNVRHVLELKKKLIFLGYLEEQGYAFSSQTWSGCLKIFKRSLVVMRDRRLSNNLYGMEGSVVNDRAEVLAMA